MIKKEFRDIIQFTLLVLTGLFIVPLLALFKVSITGIVNFLVISLFPILKSGTGNIYMTSFTFLLGFIIFLTANNYGFHAFRCEHKDQAFEYLLSFPFSKYRALLYKLIPRVAILFFLILLYEALAFYYLMPLRSIQGALFFLMDPVFFPFWVLFILAAGFFVGLFEQKNWIAVVSLMVFLGFIFISLGIKTIIRSISPGMAQSIFLSGISFVLGTLVIMVVLGTGFLLVYRKFDMKSNSIFAGRFARFVLPALASLTALSIYLLISR
jgi:ABC-type transport system involved in multi-copper enzyme maturation permease subunit